MNLTRGAGWGFLGGVIIVFSGLLAYCNSFSGAWVLDDLPSIVENKTIRQLWPVSVPLSPPTGMGATVEGRPLLNLSLALCYSVSGTNTWSYHAFNLAIHLLAALLLFGIVRRTRLKPGEDNPSSQTALAFAVALIRVVHPLNTEAVTYLIQRAESLMGLFYLLTLYCFVRSIGRNTGWLVASVVACLCGMATKEVMVSAPVIVLLYDKAFVGGSFREIWKQRRGYFAALTATWLLLGHLVIGSGSRGGTSGFGSGVIFSQYWLTQPGAIARYLRLSLWPKGQVFDYGTHWIARPETTLPSALLLVLLASATMWGLFGVQRTLPAEEEGGRAMLSSGRPLLGFLGLVFFAVLSPTSLMPGNRQTLAEQRMYLALIPVLAGVLAAIVLVLGKRRKLLLPVLAVVLAAPLALATFERNKAYINGLGLYSSDVALMPNNPYAQANFGTALLAEGKFEEAAVHFRSAVRLMPFYPIAENNLGNALAHMGQISEAIVHYREAIRQDPNFADPHNNLGRALLEEAQIEPAMAEIKTALALDPSLIEARLNLARAMVRMGAITEAIEQYRAVMTSSPENAEAHSDFGIALMAASDAPGAAREFQEAIRLKPQFSEAIYNLSNVWASAGEFERAISGYRQVLCLNPKDPSAHNNLANALLAKGSVKEAVAEFEASLAIDGSRVLTHYNLANALLRLNRSEEAVSHYRESYRLKPDFAPARQMLERLGVQP